MTPSGLDPELPLFVDRDLGPEVAAWMRTAARDGGFLVLVGDSSAGKTRLLYETARRELPDFRVLAPDPGDGELVNTLAQAGFKLPLLIVWLDELHRFLDGPYLTPGAVPTTRGTLRRLLDAPTPVVVLGTLWLEHINQLRATTPAPDGGQPHPHYPNAVDVLDDHRCRQLPLDTFSKAERAAAARLAGQDPRLATALADRQFNVTETLAGAPQLMRRYRQATDEQRAVLNAAIDARRLGIQAPLSSELLQDAARSCLTRVQPDDAWFPPVLEELTRLDRATAPLPEIISPDRREVVGYTVADFLLQHASAQRRTVRVPAVTWEALLAHTHTPKDAARLASSAAARLLYCYAEPLWRRLSDIDDEAVDRLEDLFREQGRVDDIVTLLRPQVDDGDGWVADRLIALLREHGRVDDAIPLLRPHAHDDHPWAALRLADVFREQGRVDDAITLLRARADTWGWAVERLVDLLEGQGRVEEAIALLRARADIDSGWAVGPLVDLLKRHDRVDDAITLLTDLLNRLDARKDWFTRGQAAMRLVDLLLKEGRVDDAITLTRAQADAGNGFAAGRLARLLKEHGREAELRARADAGDGWAAEELAELLEEQVRVEDAITLARAEVDAGNDWAPHRGGAAGRLADLLKEHGREAELRARADAGDGWAAGRLIELFKEHGREAELWTEVDAGTLGASWHLIELLVEQGHAVQADRLRRFGRSPDGSIATTPYWDSRPSQQQER